MLNAANLPKATDICIQKDAANTASDLENPFVSFCRDTPAYQLVLIVPFQ